MVGDDIRKAYWGCQLGQKWQEYLTMRSVHG
jgi:hypothetical protein